MANFSITNLLNKNEFVIIISIINFNLFLIIQKLFLEFKSICCHLKIEFIKIFPPNKKFHIKKYSWLFFKKFVTCLNLECTIFSP